VPFDDQPVDFVLRASAVGGPLGYVEKLGILAGESHQRRICQLIAEHTVGGFENLGAANGYQIRPARTGANQIYKTFFHSVQHGGFLPTDLSLTMIFVICLSATE